VVDTSIWVRFLAGMEPYAIGLNRLPIVDEVLGRDLIYCELTIGDRGGRPKLLAAYAATQRVAQGPHTDVVELVEHRMPHGWHRWIDAHLLASALVATTQLWTADEALASTADSLGLAHDPRSYRLARSPFWRCPAQTIATSTASY
jgi:predicted nucleic acid-binding protein